jgi:hypothetical protein
VRETRRYGIGWFFISQTLGGIDNEILQQLRILAFGFGLAMGTEFDRLRDFASGDKRSLELYQSFRDPQSFPRRDLQEFPFMAVGPVSPLAVPQDHPDGRVHHPVDEGVQRRLRWVEGVGAFAEHQPEFLLEIGLIRGEELPTPAELTSLDLNEVPSVVRENEIFPVRTVHDSLRGRKLSTTVIRSQRAEASRRGASPRIPHERLVTAGQSPRVLRTGSICRRRAAVAVSH